MSMTNELLTHHFAAMNDRQIARKLLSLATFIGKNETGLAKEKSIALLVVAAARVKSKKERLRKDIDDVKQLARKVAANAAEVARENQRLRQIIRALLRDTNGPDKDTITSSIEIVSEDKKEVTK